MTIRMLQSVMENYNVDRSRIYTTGQSMGGMVLFRFNIEHNKGCNINFIVWEKGAVLPESGQGMEHMASFDYAYKLAPVRDWLFE